MVYAKNLTEIRSRVCTNNNQIRVEILKHAASEIGKFEV